MIGKRKYTLKEFIKSIKGSSNFTINVPPVLINAIDSYIEKYNIESRSLFMSKIIKEGLERMERWFDIFPEKKFKNHKIFTLSPKHFDEETVKKMYSWIYEKKLFISKARIFHFILLLKVFEEIEKGTITEKDLMKKTELIGGNRKKNKNPLGNVFYKEYYDNTTKLEEIGDSDKCLMK